MVCTGTRFLSFPPGRGEKFVGKFLKAFDPDMHNGAGWAEWTSHENLARRFNSSAEVYTFWATPSKIRPTNSDGRPNRPLTNYQIEARQL